MGRSHYLDSDKQRCHVTANVPPLQPHAWSTGDGVPAHSISSHSHGRTPERDGRSKEKAPRATRCHICVRTAPPKHQRSSNQPRPLQQAAGLPCGTGHLGMGQAVSRACPRVMDTEAGCARGRPLLPANIHRCYLPFAFLLWLSGRSVLHVQRRRHGDPQDSGKV